MAVVNLTSGAVSKIMSGKCTSDELKPVLQVIYIHSQRRTTFNNKQWYAVALSDGCYHMFGYISDDLFISNKLQKGSIIQLTKFQYIELGKQLQFTRRRGILCVNLIVIHCKCGIIGRSKLLHPLVERATPTVTDEDHPNSHVEEPPTSKRKQDHIDSLSNEYIDDVEEHPTSIQNPSTVAQKGSSHSPTLNKKRRLHSTDDIISGFGKDIFEFVEKTTEDGLGPCYKKLGTLEEGVLKIMRMMTEKNEEVDGGFKKLETLEENVSKLTRMMMEKTKEDVVGFKKLETLEEDVSKLTRMMMEKNKEADVGYKKLETLEENVSKMAKMMMDKHKQGDVGACFKKLETLEQDVSKMAKTMMDKNKEDDVGACFKKLETLEDDVSKLMKMMMEKSKEHDMGACFEKLEKMGWGAQEPVYDTAVLLFGQSADYRKLWLHLKPESCGNWVKNAGSMFGLLD